MKFLQHTLLSLATLLICSVEGVAQNKLFLSTSPTGAGVISVVGIGSGGQEVSLAQNADGSYTYGSAFTIRVDAPVQKWEVNGSVVSDFFGGVNTNRYLTHTEIKTALGVEELSGTLTVVAHLGAQEYVQLVYGLHSDSPASSGNVEATEDGFFPNPIASGASIPKGTKVKLKATPHYGYAFGGWYEDGLLSKAKEPELSVELLEDKSYQALFVEETSPAHPKADLAVSMSIACKAGQRLIFEVSNVEDWIYIDLGDGLPKEFMVSDDPNYAMRVYCDAAVDNPQIKVYAKELYAFKAPSNSISKIQLSQMPKLKELILFENGLTDIDLTGLAVLDRLDLSSNRLKTIDLSHLTALSYLSLADNSLSTIDLSLNGKLEHLKLQKNALTSLLLKDFSLLEELIVAENSLASLTIDNCPKISSIDCSENKLTELDFKQDLNALTELYTQGNRLTGLPFIEMPLLETLDLSGNKLSWIDVSFLPQLRSFKAINCGASGALNLSRNPNLYSVDASSNSIETVQCEGLENLFIINLSHNSLEQLAVSNCPKLDEIRCADNNLTSISIQGSPKLTGIDIADNNLDPCMLDALYESLPNRIEEYFSGRLYVASDDTPERENPGAATSKTAIAKSLGWSVYTTRDGLREEFTGDGTGCKSLEGQQITMTTTAGVGDKIKLTIKTSDAKLDIKGLEGEWVNGEAVVFTVTSTSIVLKGNVTDLTCQQCLLSSLDLSKATGLLSLRCSWNELKELDLSNQPQLQELRCAWNELATLDISHNKELRILYCSQNKLQTLDLQTAPLLEELYASFNSLGSIDLKANTKLHHLSLEQIGLQSIDISMLPQLVYLELSGNELKSVDLSHAEGLKTLAVKGNKLSELDLTKSESLTYLDCSKNQLKQIDLSHQYQLKNLYCYDNQLESLDLTEQKKLIELSCGSNRLTSLDLSHLTMLDALSCYGNKLESIDLQYNEELQSIVIGNNLLKDLALDKNEFLTFVDCFGNEITGNAMAALMMSLPQRNPTDEASIYIIDGTADAEGNVCLPSDVTIAKGKNWTVYDFNGSYEKAKEYAGKGTGVASIIDAATHIWQAEDYYLMVVTTPDTDLALYDMDGKAMMRARTSSVGVARLDLSDFASGVYILMVHGVGYKVIR